jgi:diphthine synthase
MLFLIGTGLSREGISVDGVSAAKSSTKVYAEAYTSSMNKEKTSHISRLISKEVVMLKRKDLEENASRIVGESKDSDISVLTGGDPLIATTHKILFIEAKKQGAKVRIIYSSSVFTAAIGRSGLDFYRFGAVCTIPRWTDKYKPVSFYETIEKNHSKNNHSLVLLDYNEESGNSISIKSALEILEKAEAHYGKGIISSSSNILVLLSLGTEDEKAESMKVSEAMSIEQNGMACLIIPAAITDIERETMESMKGVL